MMKKLEAFYTAIAVICSSAAGVLFFADQSAADESQATARKLSESGVILPLEKIVESAKTVKPGQVLETELEHKKDRYIYEVEILDAKGQVWEVKLDARTGKLIKLESED